MAVYFLEMKTFGRGGGCSAVSAAAYRAGERIRDERTGRMYDHSERRDVLHKEIVLPGKFSDDALVWAADRATLWNAAEAAEARKNARVAREFLVALPVELSPPQRISLVRRYAQELSDQYGFAVDVAVHAPRDYPDSDPRNFHAHLLTTTREANIDGLGAKTTLDMNDARRREFGLKPAAYEWLHVRERWATVTNEALEEARVLARVDHRSLEAQHVDREPGLWIPHVAFEIERQGYRSIVAERVRAEYENRVCARARTAAPEAAALDCAAPGVAPSDACAAPSDATTMAKASMADSAVTPASKGPQSLEEIRREAREDWLRFKASRSQGENQGPRAAAKGPSRDDDLAY